AATASPLRREEQIAVRLSRLERVRGRPPGSGGGSEGGSRGHSAPLKAGSYARRFIPQTYTFSPSQTPSDDVELAHCEYGDDRCVLGPCGPGVPGLLRYHAV